MKQKRKLTAIILAIVFGPFWYLYVKRPFKALLFLVFFAIPIVNVLAYLYMILSAGKEVQRYNMGIARYISGWEICKNCCNANSFRNYFCTSCGHYLKKECKECNSFNALTNKFCHVCGYKISSMKLLTLKNFISKA